MSVEKNQDDGNYGYHWKADAETAARVATELLDTGRSSVLRKAAEAVQDREERYGHPSENLARIAAGWRHIFGVPVSPRQVAQAMVWVKVARDIEKPDPDNPVDICGYGALMGEL